MVSSTFAHLWWCGLYYFLLTIQAFTSLMHPSGCPQPRHILKVVENGVEITPELDPTSRSNQVCDASYCILSHLWC